MGDLTWQSVYLHRNVRKYDLPHSIQHTTFAFERFRVKSSFTVFYFRREKKIQAFLRVCLRENLEFSFLFQFYGFKPRNEILRYQKLENCIMNDQCVFFDTGGFRIWIWAGSARCYITNSYKEFLQIPLEWNFGHNH